MSNSDLLKQLEDMKKLVKKHEKLLRYQHEQIKCLVASENADRGFRRELRARLDNQGDLVSYLMTRINTIDGDYSTSKDM
jgi:hypothetical protein